MNLIVDIGNTQTKAALFNGVESIDLNIYPLSNDLLNDVDFIKRAKRAIISSVANGSEIFCKQLNELIPAFLFNAKMSVPLINFYNPSYTLGADRIAASVGGFILHPSCNVLVIDAGTCLKYNFINNSNQFLGGGISPGLVMRFKALNTFTGKLPLIDFDEAYETLIGNSTQNSILSGVLYGSIAEVDGIINLYKMQYPDLICVITGGDSAYFAKRLKNTIFVYPQLVLTGLNHILNSTL